MIVPCKRMSLYGCVGMDTVKAFWMDIHFAGAERFDRDSFSVSRIARLSKYVNCR